jgi:hypothetical protein
MKKLALLALGMVALSGQVCAADTVLFEENFNALPSGALPKGFLALAGEFSVVVEGEAHYLELPGSPLDTFGVLFGPASAEPCTLEGRFFGTKTGRKFPTFGLSLRGAGGYRLQVSPGKGQLEIYKGDDPLLGVPFAWQSGSWTQLKLSFRRQGAGWIIEGSAWTEGGVAPTEHQIRWEVATDIAAGRAAIWGSPYSGTPVRFDDLRWIAQ